MKLLKPEAAFQSQLLDLALLCQWRRAHFRPALTVQGPRTAVAGDGKGFLDLLLLRGQRLIVAELKVPPRKTTPEQEAWLAAWRLIPGAEVYTWRPVDFDDIQRILA